MSAAENRLHSPEAAARRRETVARKSAAFREAGVPTRSGAIRAKCYDCIYDPLAGGTALEQVRRCSVRSCPLWPYRPGADPLTELGADFDARTPQVVLEEARRR